MSESFTFPFYFCKNSGLALPINALPNISDELKHKIRFNDTLDEIDARYITKNGITINGGWEIADGIYKDIITSKDKKREEVWISNYRTYSVKLFGPDSGITFL